jgi:aryl-alcohol dehydrogenase-like predicted oxidoreductase
MNRTTPGGEGPSTRRGFLQAGAAGLVAGSVAMESVAADARVDDPAAPAGEPEWRNRQPGMHYRRLGRTNLMVSEVVCGGDPIDTKNWEHLELALEMGLNYLDMAPAYSGGDTERAYGKLIAAKPGRREQVFIATKVSGYSQQRERKYRELFETLPEAEQAEIQARSEALRAERAVEKPGYHLTYYPGQQTSYYPAYLPVVMREKYGERVEGDPAFGRFIVKSVEGSLERLGTDHVDILMCPHGANAPEELEGPEILEVFQQLRQQGKVRFLGVTSHNDPGGILRKAVAMGHYDCAMVAYNPINGGYVDGAIREAAAADVGVIAMKVAHSVATHHKLLQPVPQWRVDFVDQLVPGDLKVPQKAYVWALQNPHVAAVISNLWDETYVKENLGLAGRKVELKAV